MRRHLSEEFVRFLNDFDKAIPEEDEDGVELHVIMDNYATHKTERVKRWFAKRQPVSRSLHSNGGVLAQPGRTVLRRDHSQTHSPRCVP